MVASVWSNPILALAVAGTFAAVPTWIVTRRGRRTDDTAALGAAAANRTDTVGLVIEAVNQHNDSLQKDNAALRAKIESLDAKVERLEAKIDGLEEKNDAVLQRCEELKRQIARLTAGGDG